MIFWFVKIFLTAFITLALACQGAKQIANGRSGKSDSNEKQEEKDKDKEKSGNNNQGRLEDEKAEEAGDIAGIQLTYANARVRCDYANTSDKKYVSMCKLVAKQADGRELRPDYIADGVNVVWKSPETEGQVSITGCNVKQNNLEQFCSMIVTEPSGAAKFIFYASISEAEKSRNASFEILIPYNIVASIGLVSTANSEYVPENQPGSASEMAYQSPGPIALQGPESIISKSAPQAKPLGFQPKGLNSFDFPIQSQNVCFSKDRMYFSHQGMIYYMKNGEIFHYAGTNFIPSYFQTHVEQIFNLAPNIPYTIADANLVTDKLVALSETTFRSRFQFTRPQVLSRNLFMTNLPYAQGEQELHLACTNDTLYVSDSTANRVLKITEDGAVERIAGNITCGFTSESGIATESSLNTPRGIAVDLTDQSIVVADSGNLRIRKIYQDHTNGSHWMIRTIAGRDTPIPVTAPSMNNNCPQRYGKTYSGDGGLALNADLYDPHSIAIDRNGKIFFTEKIKIRALTPTDLDKTIYGISSVLGTYRGYLDGPITEAKVNLPTGIAIDRDGSIIFADSLNHRIRKLHNDQVTTIAGNGILSTAPSDDSAMQTASLSPSQVNLNTPMGVAIDNEGNLIIADTKNFRIRKLTKETASDTASTPKVNIIAGRTSFIKPVSLDQETPASNATFKDVQGVAIGPNGTIFVADSDNNRIVKISLDEFGRPENAINIIGDGTKLTGSSSATYAMIGDGCAEKTKLAYPRQLVVDSKGNIYISDSQHHVIRKASPDASCPTGYRVKTIAGTPLFHTQSFVQSKAKIKNSVLEIDSDATLKAAVTEIDNYLGDGGPATRAKLDDTAGLALSLDEKYLFVADVDNKRVRQIDISRDDGLITTIAGSGLALENGIDPTCAIDGQDSDALSCNYKFSAPRRAKNTVLDTPVGLAVDQVDGSLYIMDRKYFRVRKVYVDSVDNSTRIKTIAGGHSLFLRALKANQDNTSIETLLKEDKGIRPAREANMDMPAYVAANPDGSLFISDSGNRKIREIYRPGNGDDSTLLMRTFFGDSINQDCGATYSSGKSISSKVGFDISTSLTTFCPAQVSGIATWHNCKEANGKVITVFGQTIGNKTDANGYSVLQDTTGTQIIKIERLCTSQDRNPNNIVPTSFIEPTPTPSPTPPPG